MTRRLWLGALACAGCAGPPPRCHDTADRPARPCITPRRCATRPLDRIIASKRAANRPRDRAVIPALEEALAAIEDSET